MKTDGDELYSEAAIYAEGTRFTADDLARRYRAYCRRVEAEADYGDEPDDFQRWVERLLERELDP